MPTWRRLACRGDGSIQPLRREPASRFLTNRVARRLNSSRMPVRYRPTSWPFYDAFVQEAAAAEFVILTGSLPDGAPSSFFRELLSQVGCPTLLDIRGPELLLTLDCRPLVIKPNREELAATVGRSLAEDDDLLRAMADLHCRGAHWVVVSEGKKAVWVRGTSGTFRLEPPQIEGVANPIGCGDVLAAGIAAVLTCGIDPPEAVRFGIAAAAESALDLYPARLDPANVATRLTTVAMDENSVTQCSTSTRTCRLLMRREEFGKFGDPEVNEFLESLELEFRQRLVEGPLVDFLIVDRAAGGEFENVRRVVRGHHQLQPAEGIASPAAAGQLHVVATDGGAPTPIAHDRLELKTGEVLRQLRQAALDVFRELKAILRVQPLALLLAQGLLGLGAALRLGRAGAALDGSLQALLKVHRRHFSPSVTGVSGPSGFKSKNCFRSPKVRSGSFPFFIASVIGIKGFGFGRYCGLPCGGPCGLPGPLGRWNRGRCGGGDCGLATAGCPPASAAIAGATASPAADGLRGHRRRARRPARSSRSPLGGLLAFLAGDFCWVFGLAPFAAARAGSDHRERDAAAALIDLEHPDLDDVADGDDFMRIANITIRHLAHVNQPAVVQADIDERTEIDHIQHGAE